MASFSDFLATFDPDAGKRGRQFEHYDNDPNDTNSPVVGMIVCAQNAALHLNTSQNEYFTKVHSGKTWPSRHYGDPPAPVSFFEDSFAK